MTFSDEFKQNVLILDEDIELKYAAALNAGKDLVTHDLQIRDAPLAADFSYLNGSRGIGHVKNFDEPAFRTLIAAHIS